jgi:hypothetical protein
MATRAPDFGKGISRGLFRAPDSQRRRISFGWVLAIDLLLWAGLGALILASI